MEFFVKLEKVPRTTYQQKRVFTKNGKTIFVEPKNLASARKVFNNALRPFAPAKRISGNISLSVYWHFETSVKRNDGKLKYTSPDLDNLQKLLQDCMVDCGFFENDAHITELHLKKYWSFSNPGLFIKIEESKKNEL